jgi:hypothetical protein
MSVKKVYYSKIYDTNPFKAISGSKITDLTKRTARSALKALNSSADFLSQAIMRFEHRVSVFTKYQHSKFKSLLHRLGLLRVKNLDLNINLSNEDISLINGELIKDEISPGKITRLFGFNATEEQVRAELGKVPKRRGLEGEHDKSQSVDDLMKELDIQGDTEPKLLNGLMNADAGVWQGYSVGTHTSLALRAFEKFTRPELEASPKAYKSLSISEFRLFLTLHDIGKGLATKEEGIIETPLRKQKELGYTRQIVTEVCRAMSVREEAQDIFLALLQDVTIGEYLKGNLSVDEAQSRIKKFCPKALSCDEFFEWSVIFHKTDAGAYKALRYRKNLFNLNAKLPHPLQYAGHSYSKLAKLRKNINLSEPLFWRQAGDEIFSSVQNEEKIDSSVLSKIAYNYSKAFKLYLKGGAGLKDIQEFVDDVQQKLSPFTELNPNIADALKQLDQSFDNENFSGISIPFKSQYVTNQELKLMYSPSKGDNDEKSYRFDFLIDECKSQKIQQFLEKHPHNIRSNIVLDSHAQNGGRVRNQVGIDQEKDFKTYSLDLGNGAYVHVGRSKSFHNWKRYVSITVPAEQKDDSSRFINSALMKLGLFDLAVSAPDSDEMIRYCQAIHSLYPHKRIGRDPLKVQEFFRSLPPSQVDELLKVADSFKREAGSTRMLSPLLPELSKETGGMGFLSGISTGSMEADGEIFGRILRGGYASQMERARRGDITGVTRAPFRRGAANKVFFRQLVSNHVEREVPLSHFPYADNALVILVKQQAAELNPTCFDSHMWGVDTKYFKRNGATMLHEVLFNRGHRVKELFTGLDGKTILENRISNVELIKQQQKKYKNFSPGKSNSWNQEYAEVTFEGTVDSKYIYAAVVPNEEYKRVVIEELKKQKITEINGKPLEEAIIVGSSLSRDMVYQD